MFSVNFQCKTKKYFFCSHNSFFSWKEWKEIEKWKWKIKFESMIQCPSYNIHACRIIIIIIKDLKCNCKYLFKVCKKKATRSKIYCMLCSEKGVIITIMMTMTQKRSLFFKRFFYRTHCPKLVSQYHGLSFSSFFVKYWM